MLETRGLTKRFGKFTAVSDVSLRFEPGKIHAVLGENGAGKSTLMKLLFGLHQPSEGEIRLRGEVMHFHSSLDAIKRGLGMVQQHFSLVDTQSVIDNIMLGAERSNALGILRREEAIAHLERLLPNPHLRLPWHALVGDLTVGQKQRVEILKLLFRESKILFLDEPTAVLTPSEIDDFFEVLKQLKNAGQTLVLITHKINEVFAVCDTFTVLRHGKRVGGGNVTEVSRDQIVEMMIGRPMDSRQPERSLPKAEQVLESRDLSDIKVSRGSLNGISVQVHASEIVGIAGVEGSGQSNFVEAIMGLRDFAGKLKILNQEIEPLKSKGKAKLIRELGCGLVPEDRLSQGLWLEESSFSNMIVGLEDEFLSHHVFDSKKIKMVTEQWARDFDVRASSLAAPVGSLSGGNQQKVIFAREVSGRKPKLLVCHQPTRGIDLGAIDLIHRKLVELRNQGLGILMLSSELDELLQVCDRIYVFFDGKVSGEFTRGGFDRLKIGAAMTGVQRAT
jgi:ABC-type uncharacterized transport system ATPase subunit